MKVKVILTSLSIASLLVSCQELDNEDNFPNNADLESVSTHASSNNVSIEDVRSLHKDNGYGTRSSVDIDCICDEAKDTLLYVYNKPDGGWIVYSSDMRVPPIIAESESGSFAD
ncbi:MAG: Spi family protease inhibitor, partial [Muribaculaceae bacterium]|nr:Spi family protease inhibitor [Muribaculaceae bacterium]